MKAYFSIILFFIFSFQFLFAQQTLKLQNNLTVIVDGDSLQDPWAGGMNAPRYSHVDFDGDNEQDLLVFDREDNDFTPYLNTGGPGVTRFEYAPQYENAFVECECQNWALAVDYDCDGKQDIFCGYNSGIDVYRQVEKNGSIFFLRTYRSLGSLLFGGSPSSLLSIGDDLPAITDIDEDGDVDVFIWNTFANVLQFNRNYAMENLGRCDTFLLEEEAPCWGHFAEVAANRIKLHDTTVWLCPLGNYSPSTECSPIRRPGGGMRHAGSTTLILDLNGDDSKDILMGDISYNNVNAAYNCGRPDYAYMDSVDDNFPVYDKPINMSRFPALFYVDIDNDGARDLLVSPNTTLRSENKLSTQVYLNKRTDNHPDFEYDGQGFLQEQSIDQGGNASPAFVDYNDDGLLDLLVGDAGIYDSINQSPDSRLLLYKNVGNFDVPMYELVDDNYLGLGGDPFTARYAPAAGDLDGDGDVDLLIGMANGKIFRYENTAGTGTAAAYSLVDTLLAGIDVGANATPFLYDLNTDGALDLFVGNLMGQVAYYENQGSALNPNFVQMTEEFGYIQIQEIVLGQFVGNTRPIIMDYDLDNEPELLLGAAHGQVEVFENLQKGLTDTLRRSAFLLDHDFGNNAAPTSAVIDSTGEFTYIVGIGRGGLKLFNALPDKPQLPSISINIEERPDLAGLGIRFYPNPAKQGVWIEMARRLPQQVRVAVINTHGQRLSIHQLNLGETFISLENLSPGMYLLQFEVEGQLFVEKLVKQ